MPVEEHVAPATSSSDRARRVEAAGLTVIGFFGFLALQCILAIYEEVLQRYVEFCAVGMIAMGILVLCILGASAILGKKMGEPFRS